MYELTCTREHKCQGGAQDLWLQLSSAAALCYTSAGWRRTGELMVCRVAELLVQRGQAVAAANVMQRQARLFLSEGWLLLGTHVLRDLLDCHLQMYRVLITSSISPTSFMAHATKSICYPEEGFWCL